MAGEPCPAKTDLLSIVQDGFAMYAKRELNKVTGWRVIFMGT